MTYKSVEVQDIYLKMVDGYLVDKEKIQNGLVETGVSFLISEEAVRKYAKDYKLRVRKSEKIIDDYVKRFHLKIKRLFLEILTRITVKYKPFPSSNYPVENINFVISPGEYAAHYNVEENYKTIWVQLSVDMLPFKLSDIEYFITHELYHIVAQLHDLQDKQSERLLAFRKKLEKPISENKAIVQKRIEEYNEALDSKTEFLSQGVLRKIDYFFGDFAGTLWHWVVDGALCVIAIEIGDEKYIIGADIWDEKNISRCKYNLMILRDHVNKAKKEKNISKELSLNLLKVLQFIICFAYTPYFGVAYGVLSHSHKWAKDHPYSKLDKNSKSTKNIEKFRRVVKIYCDKDIAKRFLHFFDAFLSIWEASAIHNDPLDPNIKTQVHDMECQKKASYAYKVLNQEFQSVMEGLKKFE